MPLPTNDTPGTAIVIPSLPYSFSSTMLFDGVTVNIELWWKYTAVANDNVIGIFGFGNLTGYNPQVTTYKTDALIPLGWFSNNRPLQIPVIVETTYYFKFKDASTTLNVELPFSLSVLRAPDLDIPVGSIYINDDGDGLPGAFMSATTGEVLGFRQGIPASDDQDVLADGTYLTVDNFVNQVKIFNPDLTLRIAVATDFISRLTTDRTTKFWLGKGGATVNSAQIRSIDRIGTLGSPMTINAVSIGAMAVSRNNAVMYYYTSVDPSMIKRWDLVGNVALSNLVTGVDSGFGLVSRCILVLSDTSIVVMYSDGTTFRLKQYSAAGALLHTWDFLRSALGAMDRIYLGQNDPNSIWIWTTPNQPPPIMRHTEIRLSDGVTLNTVNTPIYVGGAYQGVETATPYARFGHSTSCATIVVPIPITGSPVANPSGVYSVNRGKRNDTVFVSVAGNTKEDIKIPDPFIKSSMIGG